MLVGGLRVCVRATGSVVVGRCHAKAVLKRGKRPMSSGNPMFIERNHRPHPPVREQGANEELNEDASNTDFLSKHGGKVALFGFSFAAALVYRWFIGGKNRTDMEEKLNEESPMHPYESNDLRLKNSMTCEQFGILLTKCRERFPDGLSTYDDFVRYFLEQEKDSYHIKEGYIIDRVILNIIENSESGRNGLYPISFFLVALTNAINATPDDRAAVLFDIAKRMGPEEIQPNADDEAVSQANSEENFYCPQKSVASLVGYLMDACQIPSEKNVQESGVYYPFKLYRKKTAEEMLSQSIKSLNPPPHKVGYLSSDEFTEIMLSNSICLWGECYRKK